MDVGLTASRALACVLRIVSEMPPVLLTLASEPARTVALGAGRRHRLAQLLLGDRDEKGHVGLEYTFN